MAIEIDDDDSILTQPTSKPETKPDTKEEAEPTKPSPSSKVNKKVQPAITGKRSTKTGTDPKHSPEKKLQKNPKKKREHPRNQGIVHMLRSTTTRGPPFNNRTGGVLDPDPSLSAEEPSHASSK